MVKYLSEEWGKAAEAELNADEGFKEATKGVNLVLQQIVNNAPDGGSITYYYRFDDGSATLGFGEVDDADATLTQSYDTAVALDKGELQSTMATMQGKLKITGNLGKVMKHQKALQSMLPPLSRVDTEY